MLALSLRPRGLRRVEKVGPALALEGVWEGVGRICLIIRGKASI